MTPGKIVLSHAEAITFGTLSFIFRLPGGITCAAMFNHLDADIPGVLTALGSGLTGAALLVRKWPPGDLYPTVS